MDTNFTPSIGKDVIESLTIGMYEDSRFIYREYIQNSADQIDKAIKEELIQPSEAEIHINIDYDTRSISIEDNATGIISTEVQPILQNIAQSTKKRGVDKGFRGIGRLGGIAYCEELIFETSFKGENKKSILTWNALELKNIINNRDVKEDAISVIREVTTFSTEKEDSDDHYFKVILKNVTNDDLLDRDSIKKYLSMVAPVPFATKFIYKSKIYKELKDEGISLDEYKIYLNSGQDCEQIFKGYSTYIYKGDENNRRKEDEIIDIEIFKEYSSDGKLLFWGWHSISEKNQSLNQINFMRGFRLRKSNIQIGDEYTLLKLQRDRRFHFYFFGEIYGMHPDLIPNSRRDYFTENKVFFEFEQKLKSFFYNKIYKLCYVASELNSSLKRIENLKIFEGEYRQKQTDGFTDKKEHEEYAEQLRIKQEEAEKAKNKIVKIQKEANEKSVISIQRILTRVVQPETTNISTSLTITEGKQDKTKFRTDKLSRLNSKERKFVGKIFTIIRDVLDNGSAEDLICKIEEELK